MKKDSDNQNNIARQLANLKKNENWYRSIIESTDDSVYIISRDYQYLYVNKIHLVRLRVADDQIIGAYLSDYHEAEEAKELIEKIGYVFNTGKSLQHEQHNKREGRYFLKTLSPVFDTENNRIIAVSVISKNITRLKRLEEELRTVSLTDELTGLYNRRGFVTLSEQQMKMAKRLKVKVYMLYADMDNLKRINDEHGHRTGDEALKVFSAILKDTYRNSDIIARIGGDEFAIFPITTTESDVDYIASRLKKNMDSFNKASDRGYQIDASIGITDCSTKSDRSIDDLLAEADEMMYLQKKHKKR